jgi:type IV pilus assembly protein PilW
MVSMVIGLLILAALIALMLNVSRNNSEMTKSNRMIENGRFALQLLQADLSHAGYWGGFVPEFDDLSRTTAVPTDIPTAVPDPCLTYTSWDSTHISNLIGIPMQSYEIPAVVPSPTLSVCASLVTNPKASTDVLIARHVENCVPDVGNCSAYKAKNLHLQVARDNTVPPYVLSDDTSQRILKNRDGTTAELRKFVSNMYYVRNYSETAGDGIPTLMRSQFLLVGTDLKHKSAEALIEGVEGFRVEFGVDNISDAGTNIVTGVDSSGVFSADNRHTAIINWADPTTMKHPQNRGDGSPDGVYIACTTLVPCTAEQLMNVVAVKLYVLVRNDVATPGHKDTKTYTLGSTTLGPFDDGFKRHLFTQTIRLVNISSRRETP